MPVGGAPEEAREDLLAELDALVTLDYADEPTGNLDSATGREILDLLFTVRRDRGLILVLVTHDQQVAARCQRVIELRDGQISSDSDVS